MSTVKQVRIGSVLLLVLAAAAWVTGALPAGPRPSVIARRANAAPGASPSRGARDQAVRQRAALAWSRLPLRFEANAGQTDPRVRFVSRGPGYTLYLTGREAVLAVTRPAAGRPVGDGNAGVTAAVRTRLVGARPVPVEGVAPLRARSHYLLGNDPRRWRTDVPNYSRVRSAGVYPGIDLVYYGSQGRLEYDFTLAAGADPGQIRLGVAGADGVRLGRRGDLVLTTAAGAVIQEKPVAYQVAGGERRPVPARYVLLADTAGGERQVGFRLGEYDRSRPLVIDPVLGFSTYLGGSGLDTANGIALDASGNAYLAGQTTSLNFPIEPGAFQATNRGAADAFVARIDPFAAGDASLVYSTYLGGTGQDGATAIAVDGSGSAYVVGQTTSTNFPVTVSAFRGTLAGQTDAFVTRLPAAGAPLLYSSYLGGGLADVARGVSADGTGRVFVSGETFSTDFPALATAFGGTYRGNGDGFVSIFNTTGSGSPSLLYSTYLGGTGADAATGIAASGTGTAHVTGRTASADFPTTTNALQPLHRGMGDAFVVTLNPGAPPAAQVAYGTYLGGAGTDVGNAVDVDPASGRAVVTGQTLSTDFPTTTGAYQRGYAGGGDAFVTSIDPVATTSLVYSTYLGAAGVETGTGIAVDSSGNPHVVGSTRSPDFPTVDPLQPTYGGNRDAFVTQLDSTASLLVQSTFLGGSGDDFAQAVALDGSGAILLAGGTTSLNFPIAGGAPQTGAGGAGDAFLARIRPGQTVQFSASTYSVAEGAGQVSVTVTRSGSSAGTATVQVATANGSAGAGSDFTATSGTITFAPGETSHSLSIPILEDTLTEGNESFTVSLSAPSGGVLVGIPSTATITIVDNDGAGRVQFSATSYQVNENAGNAAITVVRTGSLSQAVSVRFATSNGSASAGSDYTAVAGTLTFSSGQASQTFLVPVANDTTSEANETLNLALSSPSAGVTLGTPSTAQLTILDDDNRGTVQFSPSSYRVSEAGGSVMVTVQRSGSTTTAASVRFTTSSGSATAGSDYTATSGTLNFAPGQPSQSFNVAILNDTAAESDETVTVTLSNPTGVTLGSPSTAIITIEDNDGRGTLQFNASGYRVSEGVGRATITVTRVGGSAGIVTVRFATSSGTATAASDYSATSGTLTFNSGETSKTFLVTILQDSLREPDETVNLTLNTPTGGATLGTPNTAQLTIVDDDQNGTLQFSASAYSVVENGLRATITVTRSGGSTGQVTVRYAASSGTATAGSDFNSAAGTLTFNSGVTSQSFTITILQDSLAEADETVNLALSSPTGGATLGTPSTAVLTIVDDDGRGAFQFSAGSYAAGEGDGSVTITVLRTGGSSGAASVRFATSSGTAVAPSDYTSVGLLLNFASGETSRTLTVPIREDTLMEPGESFNLTLSSPTGAVLGSPTTAVVTIQDNDGRGTLQFDSPDYSVDEAAGQATITVTRTGGSAGIVTVRYATSNGTASGGLDFGSTSNTLTFNSGETTKTFSVTIFNDTTVEPDETVHLTLSNPTNGATLGSPSAATLTIVDDDRPGSLQFSSTSYAQVEGDVLATIIVTRTGGSRGTVTVRYATSNGTAASGPDYNSASGTLTFANGETSKTFTVTLRADTLIEADETINLTLNTPTGGATLGTPSTAVLTIIDDD